MKAVYNRVEAEREIREKIFGKKSGLKHETQVELVRWERLFNMEVHRSLLSLFRASHRLLAEKNVGVKLGPNQDELAESMYLNRATETNWMILRLLPFLRRPETPVSEDWSRKWGILDDSFRFMTQGLADIGKKIAPAYGP